MPPTYALLGWFTIGARVSLPWQHTHLMLNASEYASTRCMGLVYITDLQQLLLSLLSMYVSQVAYNIEVSLYWWNKLDWYACTYRVTSVCHTFAYDTVIHVWRKCRYRIGIVYNASPGGRNWHPGLDEATLVGIGSAPLSAVLRALVDTQRNSQLRFRPSKFTLPFGTEIEFTWTFYIAWFSAKDATKYPWCL